MQVEEEKQRSKKRVGRTLLVSGSFDKDELSGLTNVHKTENGSFFLVFDNLENAKDSFFKLKEKNVKVKYSYYKVFFRLRDVNLENREYDELKNSVKSMLAEKYDANVLYFKFYTKNNKIIGNICYN